MSTDAVDLAASILGVRSDLRRLVGDKYEAAVKPYREVLAGLVATNGWTHAHAARVLVDKARAMPGGPGALTIPLIFAAWADEAEKEKPDGT